MSFAAAPVRRLAGVAPDAVPYDALIEAQEPVILEGLAGAWPLVAHGLKGPLQAAAYLRRFAGEHPVTCFVGPARIGGRPGDGPGLTSRPRRPPNGRLFT